MKLHLGCGVTYLSGYINIDYPPNQQTNNLILSNQSHPDKYADITTLHYEMRTIEEIRLHHVFEHFDRPTALRLLVEWYGWLCENGILIIETPDFDRCVKAYLIGNKKARGKILRHLYGSHDAHWAVHYDGWYKTKFKEYLSSLGFRNLHFSYSNWRGTYNITVQAQKTTPFLKRDEQECVVENLLRMSLVDNSETEKKVLSAWMKSFHKKNDWMC